MTFLRTIKIKSLRTALPSFLLTTLLFFHFFHYFHLTAKPPTDEYKLKALIISRFFEFVKWPEYGNDGKKMNFVRIGVLGKSPLMGYKKVLRKHIDLPPDNVRIFRIKKLEEIQQCHVVFISSSEEDRLEEVCKIIGEKPILTISDTSGFAEVGVLINLYLVNNKVRFEINLPAVKKSGLYFNSQLFKLARIIQ